MHTLKRHALVPYTARQMFELVDSIEEYPHFLPWCHSTRVISRTDTEVVAELEINWKGMRKSITTRNTINRHERMDIALVHGPMQKLDGTWNFIALNEHACKVTLDMEFEFTGHFIDRFFQPIFQHIANTLVDSFCKRAAELYGPK